MTVYLRTLSANRPPENYDLRPQGKSTVAAFLVDADGLALLNSAVLSSCA